MSMAWETTVEDVARVLLRHGIHDEEICEEAFDAVCLEAGRVEKAVLQCDDFHDQVSAADDEIESILQEEGFLGGFVNRGAIHLK